MGPDAGDDLWNDGVVGEGLQRRSSEFTLELFSRRGVAEEGFCVLFEFLPVMKNDSVKKGEAGGCAGVVSKPTDSGVILGHGKQFVIVG